MTASAVNTFAACANQANNTTVIVTSNKRSAHNNLTSYSSLKP